MQKLRSLYIAALVMALSAACFSQKTGPAQAAAGTKQVNVYFLFNGSDGAESNIRPLKREVPAAAPLFPAIAAMLEPPSESEQKLGYTSAAYGDMKLDSVKLNKGTARIDFSREIRADYNPGDLQTLDFETAVTKTAKQFPAVKKVIVCVNGINEFGIGMVVGRPYPCPRAK
jgi:spore germination protein GerM